MQREQFTFYRSFWDALRVLPKKEQLSFVLAICAYALDGEEADLKNSATASAFCILRPILDKARRKAENGQLGGSKSKANESKRKQSKGSLPEEGKQETETGTDTETDTGTETGTGTGTDTGPGQKPEPKPKPKPKPVASPENPVVVAVVKAVGELSPRAREELEEFAGEMGGECVCRAVDAARDAGKPTWSYIRGVLRKKREQGVRSMGDWDRIERQWESKAVIRDSIAGTPRNVQPDAERANRSSQWLEEFLAAEESKARAAADGTGGAAAEDGAGGAPEDGKGRTAEGEARQA